MRAVWVAELADLFWRPLGAAGPPPRDLARLVHRGWPVTVISLSGLTTAKLGDWLTANGISLPPSPTRRLHGALVAWAGSGFVFVDAADDPAERRFTVAHELAHYLRDFHRPRERAAAALGKSVLAVFDGARPATHDERWAAALRRLDLGYFTHFRWREDTDRASAAEEDADELACELLAPADLAYGRNATELERDFGLPPGPAAVYARRLAGPTAGALAGRLKIFFAGASDSAARAGRTGTEGGDDER